MPVQLLVAHAQPAVLDLCTAKPLPTVSPWITTGVFGGENMVAFSASSAIMWMTSPYLPGRRARCGSPRWPGSGCVVLDLGERATHDVHQRDRVAPATGGRVAGQDDQALGVPPHAGGQVVDAEQVFKLLRVPRPALHGVQQRELAVQQGLTAPGQVAEDIAHALAQPGLADGGPHGGLLGRGEGVPHLADLIGGGRDVRSLGGDVDLLAEGQAVHHHVGQLFVRQGPGRTRAGAAAAPVPGCGR